MSSKTKQQKKPKQANKAVSLPAPLPPNPKAPCGVAAQAAAQSPTVDEAVAKRRERDDKDYCSYRDALVEMETDAAKEFDKWLLTLSGVALGFSLNFVKDYRGAVASGAIDSIAWLYGAWVGFAMSSVLLVTNMLVSHSAYREYRRILDDEYRQYDGSDDLLFRRVTDRQEKVVRNKFVHIFNFLSWIGFVGGLCTLVFFVYQNSQIRSDDMSKEPQPSKPQMISNVEQLNIRSTGGPHTPRVVPQAPIKENTLPATPPPSSQPKK